MTVLNLLTSRGETKEIPLRKLMIKMAYLVVVVCVKRPADLCNMQVVKNYWKLDMNRLTCRSLGYGKTESNNPGLQIRIKPFHQDPILCPVYPLVRLEKILRKLRPKTEPRFWLSSKTPHKTISPSTMCGWLKEVITTSGSMFGMARDVWSVGASTAVQAGIWTRVSTMQKHLMFTHELGLVPCIF